MFKIENDVIKLTRGDRCIFDLAIDDYTIKNTDYINFKIYKKNGLSNPPLLSKTINQAGTLLRDFIPAKRMSDNLVGVYDKVNDVLYTNAGTGSFIPGPEVITSET